MARWSTRYVSREGFECIVELENQKLPVLLADAQKVQQAILKNNGRPLVSRPTLGPGRIPVYNEREEKAAIAREFRRRN